MKIFEVMLIIIIIRIKKFSGGVLRKTPAASEFSIFREGFTNIHRILEKLVRTWSQWNTEDQKIFWIRKRIILEPLKLSFFIL